MENTESTPKSMNAFNRVINIFASPREVFESIDQKPTWLVPFIISMVLVIIMMVLTADIQQSDRVAYMEARGMTQEQIDAASATQATAVKYIGPVVAVVMILIIWLIIAGLVLMAANMIIGGESPGFKKVFSIIAWSSVVGSLGTILITFLALSKGSMIGVGTDLSILLPAVPLGESKPFLNRLLARFDLFVFWQMVLWIIGLSVLYKTTFQKALIPILTLWIIWVVAAVGLGSVLGNFIPGM